MSVENLSSKMGAHSGKATTKGKEDGGTDGSIISISDEHSKLKADNEVDIHHMSGDEIINLFCWFQLL